MAIVLALHVTPTNADDRAQIGHLAEAAQATTADDVDLAYVDRGHTGEKPAEATNAHDIEREVVKLQEAKRAFVLLPRCCIVERSSAWATRFRLLSKIYERYSSTPAELHIVALVYLLL